MKKIQLVAQFLLIFSTLCVFAAPLKNVKRIMIQPNGDTLVCYASGDEFYNRLHDINDFTIVQNEDGYFVYADKNADNQIIATEYIAGKVDPAAVGLQPGIMISNEEYQSRVKAMHLDEFREWKQSHRDGETNHGVFSNLTVFIRFNGDSEITTHASTVNAMFNGNNDEDESMRKFFKQFSYNQLFINSYFYPEFDGEQILSYEDIHPRNYYRPYSANNTIGYRNKEESAQREFDLLERAIEYVKPMIPEDLNIDCNNDGVVDNMVFVVKGNVGDWGDLLWPHKWSFYEREIFINGVQVLNFNFQLESASTYFTVSTLCHEMFHSLGAPDLYHYNCPPDPAGHWDLMCGTSNPPQSSCVWLKHRYGNWIEEIPTITEYGTYTLEANTWEGGRRNGYLIPTGAPKQYYLLQFRDEDNYYDHGIPGRGITISRIDENFYGGADFNGVDVLDEVYVFSPGGYIDKTGALGDAHFSDVVGRTEFNKNTQAYPWVNNGIVDDTFNICNIKTAGNNRMQFTFCPLNHEIVPKNLVANVVSHSHVDLTWNAVDGADSYKVYRDEQLIAENVTDNFYSEIGEIGDGYHEYYVKSICGGEVSYRSEKQSVMLGALAEINITMTADTDKGWQGAELALSFDNAMPEQYLTIYSNEGAEKLARVVVPAGTKVTAAWNGGWDESKCHFSLNNVNTSLSDNDFKNGQPVQTFIAAAGNVFVEPQNFTAVVDGTSVILNWTSFVETQSYSVRRNGEVIADVATSSYTDANIPGSGRIIYEVSSGAGQSDWVSANVFMMNYCADSSALAGEFDTIAALSWDAPSTYGKLSYVNDEYVTNIGSFSTNWAVKFTPDLLQFFEGRKITAIEMWDGTASEYTFKIHNGNNASSVNVIHTEKVTMTGINQWVKFNLSKNVEFDNTKALWISVKAAGAQSPAPVCRYVGNDNSALLKSGALWKPLSQFDMDYSWMLRAYTDVSDEILNDMSYNIYRNGNVVATDVKSTVYADDSLKWDHYCYTFTTVLNGCEYEHSNEVCGYAGVKEVTEKDSFVYPNPTEEVMNFADEVEHYEIYDITGRKVVSSKEKTLYVKNWASGVYVVKIFNKDGKTTTEKVVKR
ncbi:MAG: T9SS type A sorting domain-containing protein [Bacteroidales bacterium]|nr:T9SS type A sorting domain-containing protein [Bacteroidales bacterium]